nr:uncharacterized protein LOC108018868 [Drosophila suzukii]
MPRRSKVELYTPTKGQKKRRRNSECFDRALPVEVPLQADTQELHSSCAPFSETWPDILCLEGGVVLHFGIKSDAELMPPPKSCFVPKARRKMNAVQSHDEIIEKPVVKTHLKDFTPERLVSIPPRPKNEAAIEEWLQLCSVTISDQLLLLVIKESAKPVEFEDEVPKEHMKPQSSGKYGIVVGAAKSPWHVRYLLRNGDLEKSIDHYVWKYKDPEAERLLSQWSELYGSESAHELNRTLVLAPLPVRQRQSLQKSWILGRPAERQGESLRMRINMQVCRLFCTLQMHRPVDLEMAVKSLDNAVYRSDVGVIEVRFEAPQIGWIWANGTVMIVNGESKDVLAEALQDIVAKTMGKENFQLEPGHRLLHLRLYSGADFPWSVDVQEFSRAHALSWDLRPHDMNFVHYVNQNIPGVAARLYDSGTLQVFAMTLAEGDEMLKQVYLLSDSYRKP